MAWQRKLAHTELYSTARTVTEYGPVCSHEELHGRNGNIKFFHVNPFALLILACQQSAGFAHFLRDLVLAAPGGSLDIVLYLDKATPGNQKRPDVARGAQCIYWTILSFPSWFRNRRNGWIPYGYLLVQDQKDAKLSDAALVKSIHKVFDDSARTPNFGDGFAIDSAHLELILVIRDHCLCDSI